MSTFLYLKSVYLKERQRAQAVGIEQMVKEDKMVISSSKVNKKTKKAAKKQLEKVTRLQVRNDLKIA